MNSTFYYNAITQDYTSTEHKITSQLGKKKKTHMANTLAVKLQMIVRLPQHDCEGDCNGTY